MGRRFQPLAFLAILITLSVVLAAASSQVRVDVRLVNVVATVTDDHGQYVPNLTQDDFTLYEDGKIQEISHFSQDQNVPVSVGILLDTSASMDRKIRTAVEAVDRFIRRIQPDDEIFLMTFSGQPLSPITAAAVRFFLRRASSAGALRSRRFWIRSPTNFATNTLSAITHQAPTTVTIIPYAFASAPAHPSAPAADISHTRRVIRGQ